jgi:hypothetical protein
MHAGFCHTRKISTCIYWFTIFCKSEPVERAFSRPRDEAVVTKGTG